MSSECRQELFWHRLNLHNAGGCLAYTLGGDLLHDVACVSAFPFCKETLVSDDLHSVLTIAFGKLDLTVLQPLHPLDAQDLCKNTCRGEDVIENYMRNHMDQPRPRPLIAYSQPACLTNCWRTTNV